MVRDEFLRKWLCEFVQLKLIFSELISIIFGFGRGGMVFEHFERMHKASVNKDRCFICGIRLNSANRSVEHVVPMWVQKEFSLLNHEISLLNGTTIKYRQLTIPCCIDCNNNQLNKKIETSVSFAYHEGIDSFRKLDEEKIFLWLNKISYGFLYKEISLKRNLKSKSSLKIYTKRQIRDRTMQYAFLQAIRHKVNFVNKAWSLYVFEIEDLAKSRFDLRDDYSSHCMLLRMGNIGIIANLQDNGTMRNYDSEVEFLVKYENMKLDLPQFYELYAHFLTKSSLIRKVPYYTVFTTTPEKKDLGFICHPLNGDVFRNVNYLDYFEENFYMLESNLGFSIEDLKPDGVNLGSFLNFSNSVS